MKSSYTTEDGLSTRREGLRCKALAIGFAGVIATLLTMVLGCAAAEPPEPGPEPYPFYQQEPWDTSSD